MSLADRRFLARRPFHAEETNAYWDWAWDYLQPADPTTKDALTANWLPTLTGQAIPKIGEVVPDEPSHIPRHRR